MSWMRTNSLPPRGVPYLWVYQRAWSSCRPDTCMRHLRTRPCLSSSVSAPHTAVPTPPPNGTAPPPNRAQWDVVSCRCRLVRIVLQQECGEILGGVGRPLLDQRGEGLQQHGHDSRVEVGANRCCLQVHFVLHAHRSLLRTLGLLRVISSSASLGRLERLILRWRLLLH